MKLLWFLFFYTTRILSQNNTDESNNTILWNQNIQLEWKDFSGEIDPNLFGSALTTYSIEIIPENVLVDREDNIQGYENLTVIAKFYKDKSWSVVKTYELLSHEQLHFDIAELYARKIRKKFSGLKEKGEQKFSSYATAYEVLWQKCREYQKTYDYNTKNGILIARNKWWINKVNEELTELNKYK